MASVEIAEASTIISLTDKEAYEDVIARAWDVHVDRERMRMGLWKQYRPIAQAQQVKIKADRVMHTLELLDQNDAMPARHDLPSLVVAEIFDIINYGVFTVRLLEGTA